MVKNLQKDNIEETVIELVKSAVKPEFRDKVKVSSRFTEDLGFDSIEQAELMLSFESELKLEINNDDAGKLKTVSDAIEFLRRSKQS